jgi:ribosomal protein L11 methyltransferase
MPYRIDLHNAPDDAIDRLIELGALDVEPIDDGVAAIVPDTVTTGYLAFALGKDQSEIRVSPAQGRDDGSVWMVRARAAQAGRFRFVPADWPADAGTLRLVDGPAFGTGLHPTTALCLGALQDELDGHAVDRVLDVGTGSGILALAALHAGVDRAVGIDIDADALRVAAENATLNHLSSKLLLVRCEPAALSGTWPLVLANVLAAPLVDMATTLARCVGRGGRLVLSGVRSSLVSDVERSYRHIGMRLVRTQTQEGWAALTLHASW